MDNFHHPLVLEEPGLARDTEITEGGVFSGESGGDDSPEDLTASGREDD